MFYQVLMKLCEKNKLKPTPFLQSLNISAANLNSWKNGSTVNSNILITIARYFKVSTDYLLGLSDDPKINIKCEYIEKKPILTEHQAELLEIYNNLSKKNKAKLLIAAYDIETEENNEK